MDALEGKMHDQQQSMKELQSANTVHISTGKPMSAAPEYSAALAAEVKNLEIMIRDNRVAINKKLDTFKDEVNLKFVKNSVEAVEARLVERINEAVKLLTRELADRQDTKKNFKLVERQIKNILTMQIFSLR